MECCCHVPGGLEKDEPVEQLDTQLLLPPWFEKRRAVILATLEPVVTPQPRRLRPEWRGGYRNLNP